MIGKPWAQLCRLPAAGISSELSSNSKEQAPQCGVATIEFADRRPQVRNSFPLRAASLILVLLILLCQLPAGAAHAEPLQDCHKVTNTYSDTTRSNKAQIRLWQVETALPAVTEEINGIASGWVEELGNFLPDAKNSGKKTAGWMWKSATAAPASAG